MKNVLFLILFFILSNQLIAFGREMSLPLTNTGDTCQFGPKLWFFDYNNDNKFEQLLFGGCPQKAKLFDLVDNSLLEIKNDEEAVFISGSFFNNNFFVYIVDRIYSKYTHKLFYDNQTSKAILEDYTDNGSDKTTYDDADMYFYTQQMGSTILITKKTDIDVLSVMLCNVEGKIITNLQNVEGWSQFIFDLSGHPSGIYLIRFTAADKALTKKVVYVR